MKTRIFTTIATITISLALAACGSSSGGGGGGGGGGLANGTFERVVAPAVDGSGWGVYSTTDMRAQKIYPASEVGGAGYITAIKYRLASNQGSAISCPETTIRMGHSSLALLATNFSANVDRSSLKTVRPTGILTLPAGSAGDDISISFSTPFYYNGMDSLVLDVVRTMPCSGILDDQWAIVGAGATVYDPDPGSPTGGLYSGRTNHTFVFRGGETQIFPLGGSSNQIPFNAAADARRIQNLYLASEINGSGPITGVGLEVGTTTTAHSYTISVKMGHATVNTLALNYDANYSGSPKTVSNNATYHIPAGIPAGSIIWLPLTSHFNYNGTDNLLLEMNVTASTGNNFVRYEGVAGTRIIYGTSDGGMILSTSNVQHARFRFNGGKVTVMSNLDGSSSQVLGGTGAAGGQIQSLYKSSSLGTAGRITSVSVRLLGNSVATSLTNYKLYMGHTDKTTLNTADNYASNMDENSLVFSGTLNVPGTLEAGDWITIPLQNAFNYNPQRNLSILFSTDQGSIGDNSVFGSWDLIPSFPNYSVGRNDNAVNTSGNPAWDWDGYVNVQLGISP